ncbi:MAG: helix-turn-helix domain-containing protein [Marinilabiliaceae bacterium]|nr:helix-turn-helix domain-containing protein [Marinilabiliaceae bacterium]
MNKNDIMTLEEFKEKHYGIRGVPKRDELEAGYENFKMGVILQQARIKKGIAQEELTIKVGASKSYISNIENNVEEVRISAPHKIIEAGLGGQLELAI